MFRRKGFSRAIYKLKCHDETLLFVRPLAAEKLAAQLPTPCKNQQHGCRACLAWSDRQLHEAECEMAVGQCPVLSCTSQVREYLERYALGC